METVTLFDLKDEDIHINISAYFEGDILVVDGYDIGKKVKEFWGDSDYEYVIKVPPEGVDFLYKYFGIWAGDKKGLLKALAGRYHTNYCYSEIRDFLDKNKVKYEGYTWT